MRSWIARHPISFMALYTVFYLTAFHWLEVNITVPAIWVHCQLDDVIPFCKYAIVPYFAWFAWIPFTLFYLLRHGERSDFWRVCLCLFAGMTIALSCYVLLPTGLALRPCRVYGSDIFARLVRMLYAVDTARNVCLTEEKCRKLLALAGTAEGSFSGSLHRDGTLYFAVENNKGLFKGSGSDDVLREKFARQLKWCTDVMDVFAP